jgi:WD40 repeat protein
VINQARAFLALDNEIVAICFEIPLIRIFNLKSKAEIMQLIGHRNKVNTIIKLNDNQTIASASEDNKIIIWNLKKGISLKNITRVFVVGLLLYLNDSLISCSMYGEIKIWSISKGTLIKSLRGHLDSVNSITFFKTDLLASGSADKTIRLWNVTTGLVVKKITNDDMDAIDCLLVLNTSQQSIASSEGDFTVKIWNIEQSTASLVTCLEGHTDKVRIIINLNTHIASASYDGTIKIWNYENSALLKTLQGHRGAVVDLSLLSDGNLASVSTDATLRLWNVPAIFKYPNRSNLIPYQDF